MRKLLLLLIFITGNALFAQVGIGTDLPNPSTQLEIISSNRGIIIPQISLTGKTDRTTITAGNLESLLVFNTSTNATLTPGYYYWFENSWHRLLTEANLPDYIVFWDITNNQFTYIDENGDVQIINIPETLTYLGLNADGHTLEYTDEDGAITSIDLETVIQNFETLTTIIDNGDGSFSYTDEDGNTTVIDLSNYETLTYLALNTDGKTLEYTDEDGVITSIDLETIIRNYETVTTIVNNGDGTYTFTNETGDTVIVDVIGDVVTNIQNHGDIYTEIMNLIGSNSDIFLDNGDGTFTHTTVDGQTVIFDANTTTMVNNGDGTYVFTNANGDTITVDVIGDVVTNIQNHGDIYTEIMNLINSGGVDPKDLTAADDVDATIEIVTGGIGATLVETSLRVKAESITTEQIKNGTIKPEDIENAAPNQVLTTDVNGNPIWVDQSEVGEIVEAKNGLNKDGLDIKLGGTLIEPTTITTDATNTLAIAGLQPGAVEDNLVVAEADGTLRQVKSAMPKFFYMPAIIFDTSVNGSFTRNLHNEYLGQFTGTSNPTLVGSSGAPNAIPNVPAAGDLYYYITYYDTDVFANLSINANGVLTYDIIGNATESSYMTIVFVVKD